jgi:hypothetical protein
MSDHKRGGHHHGDCEDETQPTPGPKDGGVHTDSGNNTPPPPPPTAKAPREPDDG